MNRSASYIEFGISDFIISYTYALYVFLSWRSRKISKEYMKW